MGSGGNYPAGGHAPDRYGAQCWSHCQVLTVWRATPGTTAQFESSHLSSIEFTSPFSALPASVLGYTTQCNTQRLPALAPARGAILGALGPEALMSLAFRAVLASFCFFIRSLTCLQHRMGTARCQQAATALGKCAQAASSRGHAALVLKHAWTAATPDYGE